MKRDNKIIAKKIAEIEKTIQREGRSKDLEDKIYTLCKNLSFNDLIEIDIYLSEKLLNS